jgi:ankyrin repeat protein
VLHEAAEWGATDCIRILVQAGADIHAQDRAHHQPISRAQNAEIARTLVEAGADINYVDGEGYSLLKHAAEIGNEELVRALLAMGADTDAEQACYTTTPLYVAVAQDDLEIAKLLLNAGANPNAQNADGWHPMQHAQSIEMAQLLLAHGADLNLRDDGDADALQDQHDPEVAAFLIESGAQVNPSHASPPLWRAADKSDLPMMRLLIDKGANVNGATSWGKTALMETAEHSFVEGMKLLLEAGASTEQADEDGRTALFYAAAPEGFTAYKLMKESEQRSWRDYLPKDTADLLEPLLQSGLIPTLIPTYGYVASDSVEVLKILAAAGAHLNALDHEGKTPLIFAASCARPARVQALLELGADTTICDAEGKTALDAAQNHPQEAMRAEIVRLLSASA